MWGGISASRRPFCPRMTESRAGDDVQRLQELRARREVRRAAERTQNQQATLRAKGKEGRTSYGRALFENYAEAVNVSLDAFLTRMVVSPHAAGKHYEAWPLLLHFADRGPRSIAMIALGVVIDKITQRPTVTSVASAVGKAMQDELMGTRIRATKGQLLLRTLVKNMGKDKVVSTKILRQVRVDPGKWTRTERRELGLLLLDLIKTNTTLITYSADKKPLVLPTDCAREIIAINPPRPLPIRRLPLLLEPDPWDGTHRNGKSLVASRRPMDLTYITKENLKTAIEVANVAEKQCMEVDPWMAEIQQQAWELDVPAFPVRRESKNELPTREEVSGRMRATEALRQADEIAGLPIWFEHDMDFRGRLYSSSRVLTPQGPDYMKGLLSFRQKEPCGAEGFEQLLAAAAGYYGLGRKSWEERGTWGQNNLCLISAVAQRPLDRFDLWRDASEPWQFVQACRAINQYLLDPNEPSGCPVRFDQTCSGMGIIAALTRDRRLARATNLVGTTRKDLYEIVAADLAVLLQRDLHGFDPVDAAFAEYWLQWPIDRSLVKGPVLTMAYGSQQFGLADRLTDWLMEKNPDVPVWDWQNKYTRPARYMARKMSLVISSQMKSCIDLETWLREASRRCLTKDKRVQWTSPMGFPVVLGVEMHGKQKTNSLMHGSRRWEQVDSTYEQGQLSARETNRAITANTIHSFDAALVHAVLLRCAENKMPITSNHDCFGTTAASATRLHRLLHGQLREIYATDWLTEVREEIQSRTGVRLKKPPHVGDLCHGEIGQNPYCFS